MRRAVLQSVVFGALLTLRLAANGPAVTARDLFELYRQNSTAFTAAMESVADFRAFREQARTVGLAGEFKVKAAFLLEASGAAYRAGQTFPAHDLLEDGCSLVRQRLRAGDPYDVTWQMTALALVEGVSAGTDLSSVGRDYGHRNKTRSFGVAQGLTYGPQGVLVEAATELQGHLRHAAGRISPGAFALARGVAVEQYAWNGLTLVLRTVGRSQSGDSIVNHEVQDRQIQQALRRFAEARRFPDVKDEAALRAGVLTAMRGDDAGAIRLFEGVADSTGDSWLPYLALLFTGRSYEGLHQADAALNAYRGALALRPDAQSAHLEVAAFEYILGNRRGAAPLLAAIATSPSTGEDPWRQYRYGDYRFWDTRVHALREAWK